MNEETAVYRVGKFLRELRERLLHNNSQRAVAYRIGISPSQLNSLENDKRQLRDSVLSLIVESGLYSKSDLDKLKSLAASDLVRREYGIPWVEAQEAPLETSELLLSVLQADRRDGMMSRALHFIPAQINVLEEMQQRYKYDAFKINRLIAKYLVEYLDAATEVLQPEQARRDSTIQSYLRKLLSVQKTLLDRDREEWDQARILPALMYHIGGDFKVAYDLMFRLAQPTELDSGRALALCVRGVASIIAVKTLKGYPTERAREEFLRYEPFAREVISDRVTEPEYKAQVLEVLGMARATLGLPEPQVDLEDALAYLKLSPQPRKIVTAQIYRSDYLIHMRGEQPQFEDVKRSAERGLKLMMPAGYERYILQIIDPLVNNEKDEYKDLGYALRAQPWQSLTD